MTELLVKVFIKHNAKVKDPIIRSQYGMLAGVVGLICNIFLFGIKMTIGLLIHSISVMADAFNNLSDAASAVIGFIGAKLSSRPADKEHPFGHGRYEYIAALIVAFLVVQVGFSCLQSSISKIRNPELIEFSPVFIIILGISIFIKLWLGLFNRALGKRIDSAVMKATAADAFGDMMVTSVMVISILIGYFFKIPVDGYIGGIVSCFILYSGYTIAKETLEPLLGQAVTKETCEKITKFVESYDGIVGSHDLIVHNYGPSRSMATIHAEVPNDSDLDEIHEVIDRIEREAMCTLGTFLIIHMDPVETNNEQVLMAKNMVNQVVLSLEKEASIHDFRMVNGQNQINLIFDLVIPHSYKEESRNRLMQGIREEVSRQDARYRCIITVEHSYIN